MTDTGADYWAIAAVKARYFRFMDLKDWGALRGIFTDDATFDHPTIGRLEEIDAAVAALRATIGDKWTSHEGSIPDITLLLPDRATGIFAMTGHVMANEERMGRTFGHYYDEFRRVDGVWKMSAIRLVSSRRAT